jgi:hypothetical protein
MSFRILNPATRLVLAILASPSVSAGAATLIPEIPATATATDLILGEREHPLYPATTATCPDLPSPFALADGREFVVIEPAVRSPGSTASPPPARSPPRASWPRTSPCARCSGATITWSAPWA